MNAFWLVFPTAAAVISLNWAELPSSSQSRFHPYRDLVKTPFIVCPATISCFELGEVVDGHFGHGFCVF